MGRLHQGADAQVGGGPLFEEGASLEQGGPSFLIPARRRSLAPDEIHSEPGGSGSGGTFVQRPKNPGVAIPPMRVPLAEREEP